MLAFRITGSSVPALVCAAILPLLLAWSCGIFKSKEASAQVEEGQQLKADGDDIVQHASKELHAMGSMSSKELVCKKKKKSPSLYTQRLTSLVL